jgi:hypothetical protein
MVIFFQLISVLSVVNVLAMLRYDDVMPPAAMLHRNNLQNMDIMAWDEDNLRNVADNIFPANTFGNITVGNLIDDMVRIFHAPGQNNPHIALARVVLIDVQASRYTYNIPYVFVSGMSQNTAVATWTVNHNVGVIPGMPLNPFPYLDAAINNNALDRSIKGIADYRFTTLNPQNHAHSERAAVLCLLYSNKYSIEHIMTDYAGVGLPAVAEIVIQIKIAHGIGMCGDCCSLCCINESVTPWNFQMPNALGAVVRRTRTFNKPPNRITFVAQAQTVFDIGNFLHRKSGVANIPIKIRVSNDNGDYLKCFQY